MSLDHIGIAGAGAFGTALALVALRAGRRVTLCARDIAEADAINAARENARHLPGIALPAALTVSADASRLAATDAVILAAPSQATRALAASLAGHLAAGHPVIAAAKGIEQASGLTQSAVIAATLPQAVPAALSGPGFAEEIAAGLPTAVTIASTDLDVAREISAALATDTFRPYASDDLVGVELGGALKNVLAIAAGIAAGMRLGESARAALIARGLAEMTRLGIALGARVETFQGLSGLGDLVLTATSGRSRNLAFGRALGEGHAVADLLAAGMPLAEGAHSAPIAAALAERHGVDAPITATVAAVMAGRLGVAAAMEGLIARPLRAERD